MVGSPVLEGREKENWRGSGMQLGRVEEGCAATGKNDVSQDHGWKLSHFKHTHACLLHAVLSSGRRGILGICAMPISPLINMYVYMSHPRLPGNMLFPPYFSSQGGGGGDTLYAQQQLIYIIQIYVKALRT